MAVEKHPNKVDPIDAQIGGDADIAGIAQTITSDDIQAIIISADPVAQRLEALKGIREELTARMHADAGGDLEPLLAEVESGIDQLSNGGMSADIDTPLKTYQ